MSLRWCGLTLQREEEEEENHVRRLEISLTEKDHLCKVKLIRIGRHFGG